MAGIETLSTLLELGNQAGDLSSGIVGAFQSETDNPLKKYRQDMDKKLAKSLFSVSGGVDFIKSLVNQKKDIAGIKDDMLASGIEGAIRERERLQTGAKVKGNKPVKATLDPGEVVLNKEDAIRVDTILKKAGIKKGIESLSSTNKTIGQGKKKKKKGLAAPVEAGGEYGRRFEGFQEDHPTRQDFLQFLKDKGGWTKTPVKKTRQVGKTFRELFDEIVNSKIKTAKTPSYLSGVNKFNFGYAEAKQDLPKEKEAIAQTPITAKTAKTSNAVVETPEERDLVNEEARKTRERNITGDELKTVLNKSGTFNVNKFKNLAIENTAGVGKKRDVSNVSSTFKRRGLNLDSETIESILAGGQILGGITASLTSKPPGKDFAEKDFDKAIREVISRARGRETTGIPALEKDLARAAIERSNRGLIRGLTSTSAGSGATSRARAIEATAASNRSLLDIEVADETIKEQKRRYTDQAISKLADTDYAKFQIEQDQYLRDQDQYLRNQESAAGLINAGISNISGLNKLRSQQDFFRKLEKANSAPLF